MPALLTRMSRRPISPSVRSTIVARALRAVTSVGTTRARRPSPFTSPAVRSAVTRSSSATAMSAPSRASSSAVARPIPRPAPVTMAIRDVSSMVISSLCRAGRDDGLGPAPRGGMGERLLDALEGETRGNEASGAEPRQGGGGAAEGGAPAIGPVDAQLAVVHVIEVDGEPGPLGIDADELDDARGLHERDGLRHQLGLAHGLADHIGAEPPGQGHHPVGEALLGRVNDYPGAELAGDAPPLLDAVGEAHAPRPR